MSEAAQLEMMELDDRFAAAVSELHSLEQAATVQRASREGLVDPKAAEVAEQVKIARQQVSDLQSKVLAAEQLSSKTQVAIDRTGRQQSELDDGRGCRAAVGSRNYEAVVLALLEGPRH